MSRKKLKFSHYKIKLREIEAIEREWSYKYNKKFTNKIRLSLDNNNVTNN